MGQIVVDGEELALALESHHLEIQYMFDRENGEVIPTPANGSDLEIEEELSELIEANFGTRFIRIEPVSSNDGWNVMSDFVEQLPESEAAKRLGRAIEGKSPFRRFKDELLNYPNLREEWFKFHEEAFYKLAKEWLDDHGIDATIKLRQKT